MHEREMTTTVEDEDLECLVQYEWRRAEPDVGIMREFPEDITLRHLVTGEWLSWVENQMTEREWDSLLSQIEEEHYD